MASWSVSATKTSGAAAGWVFELRQSSTARSARIMEIGLFTTTAAAGTYGLSRLNAQGTGAVTTVAAIADDPLVSGLGVTLDTAYATTQPTTVSTTNFHRTVVFPASVGSGIVWNFRPAGLVIAASSGLVVYQTTTAAVGLNVYFTGEE